MITQEYLRELLDHNHDTGIFTWNPRPLYLFSSKRAFSTWNARYSMKIAGSIRACDGYVNITIDNKHYFAHRLAWLYVNGIMPTYEIDHINGVKHDNRIVNLREVTSSGNKQNRLRCSKNSLTGMLGVHFHKQMNKFTSSIFYNGKANHLGTFSTKEDAHQAYVKAKSAVHPFSMLKL